MSSHIRGRGRGVIGGHRGSGGGYHRGRGGSNMRSSGFSPRSRGGGYNDRNRNSFQLRSSSSSMHMKSSDRFIPNLGTRAHFELTKALVASVLKTDDNSERRGRYSDDRNSDYGVKRYKNEGRGSFNRDEPGGRSVRQRPFSERSSKFERYRDGGGYDQYDRSRPQNLGRSRYESSDKYTRGGAARKRPPYFDNSYPPYKKMRTEGSSDMRSPRGRPIRDSFPPRRDYKDDRPGPSRNRSHYDRPPSTRPIAPRKFGSEGDRRSREPLPRRRSGSGSHKIDEEEGRMTQKKTHDSYEEPSIRNLSSYDDKENLKKERSPRRESAKPKDDSHHDRRHRRSSSKDSRRRNSRSQDRDASSGRDFRSSKSKSRVGSSMRDVRVTIKADGMRAVNSEGYIKSSSRSLPFIDLQCPHCPDHHLITFQEYKYHLDSKEHKSKLADLSYKHSHVLRNIRQGQRQELREMEDKWKDDDPEDFETLVKRYCDICKLAFKAPGSKTKRLGTSSSQHDKTKFHKMQAHYLNPRCSLCKMEFSSRMIYEHHVASIRHLRLQAQRTAESTQEEDEPVEDDKEELNLTDFITMDSVGEEEVGSEHDDITGRLEDVKAAEEEAKADEENEGNGEEEALEEEIPSEMEMEPDEDDFNHSDIDKESGKPVGMDFVSPINAVYCKLCHLAISYKEEGPEEATERHCSSNLHLRSYRYMEEEMGEAEDDLDPSEEEGDEAVFEGLEEVGFGVDEEEEQPFEEEEQPFEEEQPGLDGEEFLHDEEQSSGSKQCQGASPGAECQAEEDLCEPSEADDKDGHPKEESFDETDSKDENLISK